jgi:hypothetical protein
VLAGVLACHPFKVFDAGFLTVADRRIVLGVRRADISPNGFGRLRLIEHQVIECHHRRLVGIRRRAGRSGMRRQLVTLMSLKI